DTVSTLANTTSDTVSTLANTTSDTVSTLANTTSDTVSTLANTTSVTALSQFVNSETDSTFLSPEFVESPLLSSNTLKLWLTSFSAKTLDGTISSTIHNVSDLPHVLVAGKLNTTAINEALGLQSSILLNTSLPPLASGSTIIASIGMPDYSLPNSTSVVTVIPTVVTTLNSTSGQFIATPPFNITPGQEMLIPVADSAIPSFGGLKELDVQSSPTAISNGGSSSEEWLTAEVDNKLPSSISGDGINGTIVIFINVQYPYEQTGVGFNWGDPENHAKPPTMTLVVNKTSLSDVQNDTNGCPIIDAYTLSLGSWTSSGLGEISSSSISPTQCQIKIQSQHLSKFAFAMRHIGTVKPSGPGQFGVGEVSDSSTIDWTSVVNSQTNTAVTSNSSQKETTAIFANSAASPGFSNIVCSKGNGYDLMTGMYTSPDISYKVIFVKMTLLDKTGHVVGTGYGFIPHATVNTPVFFSVVSDTNQNFDSCTAQIDTSISQ
ncbi:MAG TPA: hypothetical protein VJ771_08535, partial [Candidatus Nitrosotalea sp.]|nr:hypothetical protein [Candidatus Nitrosotalea sp.]